MAEGDHGIYHRARCVLFRKTREGFGGFSNMATGYPLVVNGVGIPSSEALYQACRYPHLPDVQRRIIAESNPWMAKMQAKPDRERSRPDWDGVRVRIMRWCLRVKLAQNWSKFAKLLLQSGDQPIVEDSSRDSFWGAVPQDEDTLVGDNVLGRLLMELRVDLAKPDADCLRCVAPVPIPDFLLYGEPIQSVHASRTSPDLQDDPDLHPPEDALWRLSDAVSARMAAVAQAVGGVSSGQSTDSTLSQTATSVAPAPAAGPFGQGAHAKRLIEVDLPIARISAHARREKSIRHGHISTLHIWWARRPLAACRAVICAALWPDPGEGCPPRFRTDAIRLIKDFAKKVTTTGRLMDTASPESFGRWEAVAAGTLTLDPGQEADWGMLRLVLLDFIADFANWDNSTVPEYLETARALTQSAHESLGGEPGTRPLVVDPFAGGGSIPLEALRVGADAFASDLNPVAVLLNKVVLEYIPKYGQRLADEVRKWGQWIKVEAEKELAEFYPKDPDGATPIAYLWARTIRCEGAGCGAEVPLMRSLWLAKKANRSFALKIVPKPKAKRIDFEIIPAATANDVGEGTVKRGSATCPCCGYTTPNDRVRAQLAAAKGGAATARLTAVVILTAREMGRGYRLPTPRDEKATNAAMRKLASTVPKRADGLPPVPDELIPKERPSPNARGLSAVTRMGVERFGDLFTPRQQLALVTLNSLVKKAASDLAPEEARAVRTVLALSVGKVADLANSCCRWEPVAECPRQLFARQAVPIVWDFPEGIPIGESSGSWDIMIDRFVQLIATGGSNWNQCNPQIASATHHPLPDDAANAVVTDPPYYDAVPYGDLSDFFYVWLRRALQVEYPDLFSTSHVQKDEEAIWNPSRIYTVTGKPKDESFYESQMQRALGEARRITIPSGIGVVVFAHKSTAGWEAILSALVNAGWIVTASWPIDTEMGSRVNAMDTASLASSVHLVCRPRTRDKIGDWRDTLSELPKRIHEWMPRLAAEGVVGADAIFACLGPALEIFSRYSRVEKASGETATLREYLEHVWAAVSTEALLVIFKGADAAGLEPDARLTAMWLWTLGAGVKTEGEKGRKGEGENEDGSGGDEEEGEAPAKPAKTSGFALEYDAARKIAQGLGVHLEQCEGFVEVKGDKARLLPVAERAGRLFGKETEAPAGGRKKKSIQQKTLFEEAAEADGETGWGEIKGPPPGATALDRLHQAMILFGAQRGELLKRFLVEDGVGKDARFWKLAQSLSALYPTGSDEKRWVDGVLARKKGLAL